MVMVNPQSQFAIPQIYSINVSKYSAKCHYKIRHCHYLTILIMDAVMILRVLEICNLDKNYRALMSETNLVFRAIFSYFPILPDQQVGAQWMVALFGVTAYLFGDGI